MNRIGGSRSIPSKESVATKRDIAELRQAVELLRRDLTVRVGGMFVAFYADRPGDAGGLQVVLTCPAGMRV